MTLQRRAKSKSRRAFGTVDAGRPGWVEASLEEQAAYYRAQAPEYRRVDITSGSLGVAREKLLKLGPLQHILELAPGTGDWTQELVRIGQRVTAIDVAPEMIELNKQRVADPRVEYRQGNLFEWMPQQQYDLVFFSFWLSHVPPDSVDVFLLKVRDAVRPGGHLFIIDQCDEYAGIPGFTLAKREGIFEARALPDGRTFTIVKIFYHPGLLAARVRQLGFEVTAERVDTIFYLSGMRSAT